MGNRGSHKEIDRYDVNAKGLHKKNKKSLNSKSVDNFFNSREPSIVNENNVSQNKSVTKLEVKIFRSYTNLNEFGSKKLIPSDRSTNIRIYKKSSQKIDSSTLQRDDENLLRPIPRSNSLPRNFGKSKALRYSAASISSTDNTNSLRDGRYSRLSLPDRTSNGHKVPATKVDFASAEVLQERIQLFENSLVEAIWTKLTKFSLPFQTSLIPLALFPPSGEGSLKAHTLLTLKRYIEDKLYRTFDPLEAIRGGTCALFVPPSLFREIPTVKEDPSEENVLKFASSIFKSMCQEAAADLSRMYEYQIGLLVSDLSMSLLANFIADRMVSFVTKDMKVPLVDRNSLLLGALKGRVDKSLLRPAVVSVILGLKELKWDVYEIVDKPGLRKNHLLDRDGAMLDDGPFQFFSSPSSDHMTYGYRGQLLELDFGRGVYRHHRTEVDDFPDEVLWRYDDVHRSYPPHFHFVGEKFFKQFVLDRDPTQIRQTSLNDYAKKILDATVYSRDDIVTAFKPMNRMNISDDLLSNFVGSDLLCVRVPECLLDRSNASINRETSPVLSTRFLQSDIDSLSPSRCLFTSTPDRDQNGSNHFPTFNHQSPASSNNDNSFFT